jgi:hypothetical protein
MSNILPDSLQLKIELISHPSKPSIEKFNKTTLPNPPVSNDNPQKAEAVIG